MKYPAYVQTPEDKAAYEKARKRKWTRFVHNASDILAIKENCYFDLAAAERVEKFFRLLRHSKGEWAGQPLELQGWQRDRIIYPLFGWKRPDGTRRFRSAFIFIPKKNGKSTIGAGISLYLLVADGEVGAEVYNAAADRSNALNVFKEAKNMVEQSPTLSQRLEIYGGEAGAGTKTIYYPDKRSTYQALSADAASAEGKNIHGLVFDELHTQKSRDLWKALQGGGGARRQPLMIAITTAGDDTNSLCHSEYERTKKVMAGVEPDWEHFGYIAEAEEGEDPGSPDTWIKANPGLGVSPKRDYLATRWRKAKGSPEDENDFKQLNLNMWVQRATSAIPLTLWDKGGGEFDIDQLLGRECWGGLDLGSVSDLTALELLFPEDDGTIKVLSFYWCPEDRSGDRQQKRVSYLKWIKDGVIKTTEGKAVDYGVVRAGINEIASRYKIRSIAVDYLYQGMQLATELLNEDGLPIVSYRNGVMSMATPSRQFMDLVMDGKLRHGSNPVLRWMAGNLVFKKDAQGNLMPDKAKSHEKIDGITGIIMALGVYALNKSDKSNKRSYYNDHELLILGEESSPPPEPEIEQKPERPILGPIIRLVNPNLRLRPVRTSNPQ